MMRYLSSGKLLGVVFRTCADEARYYLRLEATPRAAALLAAMGVMEFEQVGPQQDAGRTWYQVEIDDRLLDLIRASVDGIGDIVYNTPSFGQLMLIDEAQNE